MEWLSDYDPYEFVGNKKLWFLISALVLAIGVGGIVWNTQTIGEPFRLGIDFLGGTMVEVEFEESKSTTEITQVAAQYSTRDPLVQDVIGETGIYQIRLNVPVDESLPPQEQNTVVGEQIEQLKQDLTSELGENTVLAQETVGPTISGELLRKAIIALLFGSLVALLYIFIRFSSMVFAFGAILALLHDVFITLGIAAVARIEINAAFIAVVLTIIGYSLNDTIVIYDRIRENLRNFPTMHQGDVIDLSLTQTLQRSINTSGTTLTVLIALLVFGGHSIFDFVAALSIGVLSGTYSSIFFASPLVHGWTEEQEERDSSLDELAGRIAEKTKQKRKGTAEEEADEESSDDEPESIKAPDAGEEEESESDRELLSVEIEDDEEDDEESGG